MNFIRKYRIVSGFLKLFKLVIVLVIPFVAVFLYRENAFLFAISGIFSAVVLATIVDLLVSREEFKSLDKALVPLLEDCNPKALVDTTMYYWKERNATYNRVVITLLGHMRAICLNEVKDYEEAYAIRQQFIEQIVYEKNSEIQKILHASVAMVSFGLGDPRTAEAYLDKSSMYATAISNEASRSSAQRAFDKDLLSMRLFREGRYSTLLLLCQKDFNDPAPSPYDMQASKFWEAQCLQMMEAAQTEKRYLRHDSAQNNLFVPSNGMQSPRDEGVGVRKLEDYSFSETSVLAGSSKSLQVILDQEKKKNRKMVIVFVLAGVLALLIIGVLVSFTGTRPTVVPAIDSTRFVYSSEDVDFADATPTESTRWFDTPEESIEAYLSVTPPSFISEPLSQKVNDGILTQVNYVESFDRTGKYCRFTVSRFWLKNGQYSSRLTPKSSAAIELNRVLGRYVYTYDTEEEKVAEYMSMSFEDCMLASNLEYPYIGASTDPNIKNLTILGMPPKEIIEYEHEGVACYFWYYDYDFLDYLSKDPEFSFESFTIRQLIEVLNIKIDDGSE